MVRAGRPAARSILKTKVILLSLAVFKVTPEIHSCVDENVYTCRFTAGNGPPYHSFEAILRQTRIPLITVKPYRITLT